METNNPLPAAAAAEYPWTGEYLTVDAGRLHYLDEGPRDASPIVCVHGNPTWSFYWRALVARFSDQFRVVVPDHIGCGLSDKPQDWPYRLAGHTDNLCALVETLDLQGITLVVHDWGGAIGMGMATRLADRIRRVVITNTAAFPAKEIPLSIATVKIPVYGDVAVRGFNGFARVALVRAAHNPLSRAAKEGLLFPYDSWANRVAHLRFVQDIPMDADHPSWAELNRTADGLAALRSRPMMICWGDDDFCFTPRFRKEWQERFPDAEVHAWSDVGHYVMEDAPDRTLDALAAFLQRTEAEGAGS